MLDCLAKYDNVFEHINYLGGTNKHTSLTVQLDRLRVAT